MRCCERIRPHTELPLIAAPNAGMPQTVDGRTLYMASPEYMAEFARRFVNQGVSMIGGCCGTTPSMIREMRSFVRSVVPGMKELPAVTVESCDEEQAPLAEVVPIEERSEFRPPALRREIPSPWS